MKRAGQLYPLIAEPDNIRTAFLKAAKGRNATKEVIEFKNDFNKKVCDIREKLLYPKSINFDYHFFRIFDPKMRDICVAPFSDRVLQHAVMNICEPVLEKYAIYDSYACRKGKGTRKAVIRAGMYAGKNQWYLKLDIRKYFASIDHDIVLHLLLHHIKDKKVLLLFERVLSTYHTAPGKGLPVGNLISQHIANYYLSRFDHWVKEERKIRGYLRYMDDFILFAGQKELLKNELTIVKTFLSEELELDLKDNVQLNRCSIGIPFLGYRVFSNKVLLSPAGKQRFIRKFRKYEKNFMSGKWSMNRLVKHIEPLIEWTKGAGTFNFRKKVMERFGVLS